MMRFSLLALCAALLVTPGFSYAQSDTLPVTTAAEPTRPARSIPNEDKAAIDRRFQAMQSRAMKAQSAPRDEIKAPPSEITLAPGVSSVFAIARHHLNRLATPFSDPQVKTTSTAATSVEANIVYVSSDTAEPVSFYIYDKGNPDQTISVSMVPADIPPVSVTLHLLGYTNADRARVLANGDPKLAEGWESNQPFLSGLKYIFRDIALGKIPDGYSLATLPASALPVPGCFMPGVSIRPRQILEGYNMRVFVAKVTNTSPVVREIDERDCAHSDSVLAVAVWPIRNLVPGDSTEMYIAMRAPSRDQSDTQRPSLIDGAR